MIPSRMTAPLFDDAVIKEEEKDDSEPDLERNQQLITPQVAEAPEIKQHYQEEEDQKPFQPQVMNMQTPDMEQTAPEDEFS